MKCFACDYKSMDRDIACVCIAVSIIEAQKYIAAKYHFLKLHLWDIQEVDMSVPSVCELNNVYIDYYPNA